MCDEAILDTTGGGEDKKSEEWLLIQPLLSSSLANPAMPAPCSLIEGCHSHEPLAKVKAEL
jgi:hypothetical protein